MERSLHPELLDALPPSHPDALHNRRDLRLTNAVMRNHAWIARTLAREGTPGQRVLEIGAGTGELGQRLNRAGILVDGLDRWPRPPDWPERAAWHEADITTFDGWGEYDAIIGNLIYHQFDAPVLARIGEQLYRATLLVACEPVRRRTSQIAFAAIGPLLGANHVSLHDAHVSIGAGFVGDELPRFLGLRSPAWRSDCRTTLLGAYRMIARQIA